jgi:hypothetical protein
MLHPDDVTDAVKVLENDNVTLWRKPDGSLLTTDASGHPPMPHNVRETFWQLPLDAQVSEIFRLVKESEINSGKAMELLGYLQLIPSPELRHDVRNVFMGMDYGDDEETARKSLRKLGVNV